MITITNEKVAGFEPCWAAFRGFSLLFDNPGTSLTGTDARASVDCDVDEEGDLRLYKALADGIEHIGRDFLTNTYLFCALPSASYHVTVWDGVNDGNLAHVVADQRPECERFLQRMPCLLCEHERFPEIAASALVTNPDWNIQFRFERLEKWSDISLVAQLAPDDASAMALRSLTDARAGLSAAFEQTFGVRPHDTYVPHVTLGYFANRALAEQTTPCVERWNQTFRAGTTGLTLRVHSVSLYGFTDMATFFKAVRSTTGAADEMCGRGHG